MIKDEQLNELSSRLMDLVVEWAHENNIEPTADATLQVGAVFLLNSIDLFSTSKFGDEELTKDNVDEIKSIIIEAVEVYHNKEAVAPSNTILH